MAHDIETNWAASVFISDKDGRTPLILDEGKRLPHYWKLPGGISEPGETPQGTAFRETVEEVGIKVPELRLLKK